jgi:Flp pilus assembly protein TadG
LGTLPPRSLPASYTAEAINPSGTKIRTTGCTGPEGKNKVMQMLRDERGQTTILMTVIMATFLFGFIAMGVDVEYLFRAKRMAQAAADAAAVAAAEEYGSSTNEQNAANAMAKFNGFDTTLATNPAVVTITPEQYSNYDGTTASLVQNSYVTVKVSQPIRTFFMGMLKAGGTVTVSATATAGGGLSSPTCVCLEGTSGMDLNLSNNAKFTASGCGTTVNSSSSNAVGVVGSATLTSAVLGTVSSTWDNSSNINNAGTISSSTHVVLGISNGCSPTLPVVPSYSASACTADPLTHYGNGGSSYSVGQIPTLRTAQRRAETWSATRLSPWAPTAIR